MTKPVTAKVDPAWTYRSADPVTLWVAGKPEPKGSAQAFHHPGQRYPVFRRDQLLRPIVTSDNPKVKAWQKTIGVEAKCAMKSLLIVDPVAVDLRFFLVRPQKLKGDDVWHTSRPDLDKLARSVLDALTNTVYLDDGQVVMLRAQKHYANDGCDPGVLVVVTIVSPDFQPPMF